MLFIIFFVCLFIIGIFFFAGFVKASVVSSNDIPNSGNSSMVQKYTSTSSYSGNMYNNMSNNFGFSEVSDLEISGSSSGVIPQLHR